MIFYLPIIILIWSEVYYVYNKAKLDNSFKNNLSKSTIYDLVYYFSRIFYYPWLILGLFKEKSDIFIFLILLILLKIPFYFISKKLYFIWNNILPAISVIFMIIAFVYYLKG
jgi:hypothetical protein